RAACDVSLDAIVDCVEGYVAERFCDLLYGDKTCTTGESQCSGRGQECNVVASFDSCAGDRLTLCVDGYQQQVDCKKLGFLGCLDERYGANCRAEPIYK
ncbi:MAG: hypothetical protein JRH20_23635, partial [Deltaproteobacteria bacterium]|nr:hypothetical protein [Deltaproteobacteria bacterium]